MENKSYITEELKAKLAEITRHEKPRLARTETAPQMHEIAVRTIENIMQKGKLRKQQLALLHSVGVYLLGLLSAVTHVTPQAAKAEIDKKKFIAVTPEQVEEAINGSDWFYYGK